MTSKKHEIYKRQKNLIFVINVTVTKFLYIMIYHVNNLATLHGNYTY